MNSRAVPVLFGAICLGAAVWASWRLDTNYHWNAGRGLPRPLPAGPGHRMRTQAHRTVGYAVIPIAAAAVTLHRRDA